MTRFFLAAVVPFALLASFPAADPTVVEPFDGKDLKGWKPRDEKKNAWTVGVAVYSPDANPTLLSLGDPGTVPKNELVNLKSPTKPSSDFYTEQKFGDLHLEIEFMIPKGSNSGVYLMGEYEVQILDSYGKEKVGPGDMGGIYNTAAPKVNACKKPGEWQKFVIDFQAPKFDGDKKTVNGKFIKVVLNDQVIHENVELPKQTPGGLTGKEVSTGPLMLQGDHGPVAFRNIRITPK